jgi:flagellin-like hook-associated protein FlgL
MTISDVGPLLSPTLLTIHDIRTQLDDLQRQLGTGEKADTFAGLGPQAGLAVALKAQLTALGGFDDTIGAIGTRINLAQTALGQISSVRDTVQAATVQPGFSIDATGQTSAQETARNQLDQILAALNVQAGDRYLFSGSASDQAPVDTVDHILDGNGAQAGLKQVIAERNQADLGANGLGRLVIPPAAGTTVSVSEDVAGSPFGLKLAGISSTLAGATTTGPTGSPPSVTVNLSGGNPNSGDTLTLTFTLPDGSSEKVTLQATSGPTPGPNQFAIGATPATTAANLQAALTTAVGQLAHTALPAASAIAAANDFFNTDATHPPQRVAGPPFASATALVAGTPANTVSWYTGEAGAGPARDAATARIDPSLTVSYGLRANEEGIRWIVQHVATLAATSYAASDPNAAASYAALNQRLGAALSIPNGVQKIDDIGASLASAQTAMTTAKSTHQQTANTLTDMLQQIEGVSQDQVGAQILALQTTLQASLATTARMAQISLLNYLPPA